MERNQRILEEAAQAGDIDALYALLRNEPELLERIDQKPFYHTPSHVAASAGQTLFALEILGLTPSLGKKLNSDGLSSLHLALRNQHFKTVKQLVKHHPELVLVKGRGRITPLHYVAEMGDADLLAEFLLACPSAVQDLTAKSETAVHVAVRNRCQGAFEVLFGWLLRFNREGILQWRDAEGNTALHIAASMNQPEMVSLLVKEIPVNGRNSEGLTAFDMAGKFPGEESDRVRRLLQRKGAFPASSLAKDLSVAEFLRFPRRTLSETMAGLDIYMNIGLSGDMRNALLVVAVLIATATYQSMLEPPGGYLQVESTQVTVNSNGTLISGRSPLQSAMPGAYFYPFMWLNTIAFASSVRMITFLLTPSGWYNIILHASLICLTSSYSWTLFAVSPSWVSPLIYSIAFDIPYILQLSPWLIKLQDGALAAITCLRGKWDAASVFGDWF